jgi:hypothetical protein
MLAPFGYVMVLPAVNAWPNSVVRIAVMRDAMRHLSYLHITEAITF